MKNKNVYGVILAGGNGSRMGDIDKPKQFLTIGAKPIIIHTLEKFQLAGEFDAIIVLVSEQWVKYTNDIIAKYLTDTSSICVVKGGITRNDTLNNAIEFISNNYEIDDATVVVTHDSVRPFVTNRVIVDNIQAARKYGCCDTVIPATDTIVTSLDGVLIQSIPDRKTMYRSQTPQSFKINEFKVIYESLTDAEKNILTDACKIFTLKGRDVFMVKGENTNYKITYAIDVKVAESFLVD